MELMIDKVTFWEILFNEIPVHLECTTQKSDKGVGKARWKTPALVTQYALQVLTMHRADAHGKQGGGGGKAKTG